VTVTARGHRYRWAWGIQTAEGTPQVTNASLYEVSLDNAGGGLHLNSGEVPFDLSDTNDLPVDFYIPRYDWSADATIPVDVDSIGSLLKLHYGVDTPSGAGPYTHPITKADAKSLGTFLEMMPGPSGGTDYWFQGNDGLVRGVTLSGAPGEYVKAKMDVIGKSAVFNPSTPPAPGRDMRESSGGAQYATMVNAVIKLDYTGSAGTVVHNVTALEVISAYASAAWLQTDAVTPSFYNLGEYSVGINATVLLTAAEFPEMLNTFFGTTTVSTSLAQPANPGLPTVGQLDALFAVQGGTASRTLEVVAPAIRWVVTDLPTVATNGDAISVTLQGLSKQAANPITFTAVNNRPAY
jgi:hypothetical protein